ncbi:OmpH family outer membrane protein [Reichenbachiella sp. MALMAid0571]|uniref:OmpH family outer membrane protein n=1 Tax=Reichenbachiella sp. MALMAid0571 TaxID=3143939 RepID=UPI0032E04200
MIAKIIISAVIIIGAFLAGGYVNTSQKTAYVNNQLLFDGFHGKVELENELLLLKNKNKEILDSLKRLSFEGHLPEKEELIRAFYKQQESFARQEIELSELYTSRIWKRLNEYVGEYGVMNDYDFILGTYGEGNLMYATEKKDITNVVLEYVNDKYEDN